MSRPTKVSAASLTLLLFLTCANIFATASESHPWYRNRRGYASALEEQKKLGRLTLLYFYTGWCPYCKNFKKKILKSPEVKAGLEPAIKVQIDVEKEKKLAKQFRIDGFPRLLVLKPDGTTQSLETQTTGERFLKENKRLGVL